MTMPGRANEAPAAEEGGVGSGFFSPFKAQIAEIEGNSWPG